MENVTTVPEENQSTYKLIKAIYILNFVSIIFPVCSIVGVVLAYIFREDARGDLQSHFQFLIRTFWIGMLYYLIAGLLCMVLVGFILLLLVTIWWIIRNAKGFKLLLGHQPILRVSSWWF